jgi:hypothetical protein
MTSLLNDTDPYNRQARLYPALLAVFPAIVSAVAWFPGLLVADIRGLIATVAVSFGVLFLLADISRSRGKALEPSLLQSWGGWPTTAWLRHRDTNLSADTKARYHRLFSERAGVGKLPSSAEEDANLTAADAAYGSAIDWLKEQCRGAEFALVQRENATYGFRRNLLALKPIGIFICFGTVVVSIFVLVTTKARTRDPAGLIIIIEKSPPAILWSTFLALAVGFVWILGARRSWVRSAADQYARALLASCDNLKEGVV